MSRRFDSPADAEAAFYQAFRDLDLVAMEAVWDDELEPLCIHPAGVMMRGKASILQSWAEIFGRARPPVIEVHSGALTTTGDLVIHLVEELIRPGDRPKCESTRLLSTNIFRRGRDGWRLLVHHASLPLVEGRSTPHQPLLH